MVGNWTWIFIEVWKKKLKDTLTLILPEEVKVQPSLEELRKLCERIQSEAGAKRSRDATPLEMPKDYGGRCQLVAIARESLSSLEAGSRSDDNFHSVMKFVQRTNFENIPPIFVRVKEIPEMNARVVDGRDRVLAAMETNNHPYLLAYVLTEDLRKLQEAEIGYKKVKRTN